MPRPPEYRIIYHWDGAPHGYSEVSQSMESSPGETYAHLEPRPGGEVTTK